jgi:hypothetical protein
LVDALNQSSGLITTSKYLSKWEAGDRKPGYVWGPVIEHVLGLDLHRIEAQARATLSAGETDMSGACEVFSVATGINIPVARAEAACGRIDNGLGEPRSDVRFVPAVADRGHESGRADEPSADEVIHAAIPQLRRTLDSIDLPDDGPTRSNRELAGDVAEMIDYRLQARYVPLARRLPSLISELARAAQMRVGHDGCQAAALLTLAFRAADGVAYKYGYLDLSARIIDLMRSSAVAAEDPLLLAAVAYVRTETFFATGDLATASRLLMTSAAELPADLAHSAPSAAAYGALHMRAAVVAGRAGKPHTARDHLNEARSAARAVPDGIYFGTAFGPSSVRIHELAVAVELGDSPAAVERAAAWHPPEHLPAERRSHYYIDLARAQLRLGHHEDAHLCLHTARRIAPLHVREHRQVRDMLATLLRTHRSPDDRLLGLAAWARVR